MPPLAIEITPASLLSFLLFCYSIILHEIAHGAAALWYGDETAKYNDRLTLNPVPHIDPVGTIIFPLIQLLTAGRVFIGWAKPVPVNPYNLHPRTRGEVVVAIAGVTVNLLLAVVFAALLALPFLNPPLQEVIVHVVFTNIALAVFNLLPIPPLDGSHVLEKFLPAGVRESYRQIGFYGIFIILILSAQGGLARIIGPPIFAILEFLLKYVTRPLERLFGS